MRVANDLELLKCRAVNASDEVDRARRRAQAASAVLTAQANRDGRERWPHGQELLGKMLHALGWSEVRRNGHMEVKVGGWRNHYSTSGPDPDLDRAVQDGLCLRGVGEWSYYVVAVDGARALRQHGWAVVLDGEDPKSVMHGR